MISAYSSFQLEATFTYAIALNFKQDIENIFSTGTNIVYICMLIKSEFQLSNMFCLKQNTQYPKKQNDVAFSQIISFCIRHENSFIQFLAILSYMRNKNINLFIWFKEVHLDFHSKFRPRSCQTSITENLKDRSQYCTGGASVFEKKSTQCCSELFGMPFYYLHIMFVSKRRSIQGSVQAPFARRGLQNEYIPT